MLFSANLGIQGQGRVGIACALCCCVLTTKQLITVAVGVTALAGLTYTVTKRGMQRRANAALFWGETLANKRARAEAADARALELEQAAAEAGAWALVTPNFEPQ